ncbi:hypothetical protein AD932_04385, partial [Gluconobacter oxydans]
MFSHIMLGSNDIARSKTFYDATMGVLGCEPAEPNAKGRLTYAHSGGRLGVWSRDLMGWIDDES